MEGMKHITSLPSRPPECHVPVHGNGNSSAGRFPQVMRIKEVVEATSLSRTTLWRRRRTGEFPTGFLLGGNESRAVGWISSDIEAWIRSRPAA